MDGAGPAAGAARHLGDVRVADLPGDRRARSVDDHRPVNDALHAPASAPDGDAHQFFNRDLSWLDFNARVLDQARRREAPLLSRVKFLAIFGSNLDEFFMVRVWGLFVQL
jgi:polyphosphate kinase